MVKYRTDQLSEVFGALADPTRRAILARLALGETTIGELAEPFEMSLPAVSKHLGVLESAGLIHKEKQGRVRRCQLNAGGLRDAADWIEHYRSFWEQQFESLARYLEQSKHNSKKTNTEEDNDG